MPPEFNTETVRVNWSIETGFVGGTHEGIWKFEPGELPTDLNDQDRLLEEMLQVEIGNHISAGWSVEA